MDATDRHYHSIDFMKGICVLFIIITHYSWENTERLRFLFPFWIHMAVPIFMIISGFVYTKSFLKKGIDTIDKVYTVDFFFGKVIRYTVPFTIAFLIEEIIFKAVGASSHSIKQIIYAFLSGGYGPGSYYYPIMVQFIFYFPIIYAIIRKYERNGLVLCGFINLIFEVLKWAYFMNEECYRLLIFRYTLVIAYGCYLAINPHKRDRKLSIICVCTGITYIVLCEYIGIAPPITNLWTGPSFWACLFIIPIAAPMILSKIHNRVIELFGRASYNIFLVQMVYYLAADRIYGLVPNRLLQLIINLIVCVIAGVVFYFFETPVTKMVNNKMYSLWNKYRETISV